MRDGVIMRCGANYVTLVAFNDNKKFTDALSYPIYHDGSGDEAWLAALSKTIEGIPSDLRANTVLVIPPNGKIFVKHLELPNVEKDNYKQAIKFEFQRNFPGNEEEWIWDTYHHEMRSGGAFVVAMQRIFAERLLDVLLRRKVNFSYLCPEIILNAITLQEFAKDSENAMLLHIGSETSLVSICGNNAQHMRVIPLAFDWVDDQISSSQQIPAPDARKIKLEYVQKLSQSPAGLTFITYYIRQFVGKIQQELKRSELFFCRTFGQSPVTKIILSGKCSDIATFAETLSKFNANTKIETTGQLIENILDEPLEDAKQNILLHNAFAYMGACSCILENKTKLINLFSEDFRNQISFQRRHPSYMAATVIVVFSTILGFKLLSQQVNLLEFKRLALEAKLRESVFDAQKYHEAIASERKLRSSIVNIKHSLHSQDAWISLFNDLQQSIRILKTSWVDSLAWSDSMDRDRTVINATVKVFVDDQRKSDEIADSIEQFLDSLNQSSSVADTTNPVISPIENNVLTFSFGIELNQDSRIVQ
jgi:ribosomal 50S subunit-associated protein YjgA (DUF615 family)